MTDSGRDVAKAPARRDPLAPRRDPFSTFRTEMDRLFDDFMGGREWMIRPWSLWDRVHGETLAGDLVPRVDIKEEDDRVVVTAELPGLTHEDVDLTLRDDVLTLKGEKRSGDVCEEGNRYVSERRFGSFSRSFRQPEGCDLDHLEATVDKGVLTVTVVPEVQTETRKITVEAA